MNLVSNFLMNENRYVQTIIYSVPVLNIAARLYQQSYSIDTLKNRNDLNVEAFKLQQKQFNIGRLHGSTIQLIFGIALSCLLSPPILGSFVIGSSISLLVYNRFTQIPGVNKAMLIEGIFEGY